MDAGRNGEILTLRLDQQHFTEVKKRSCVSQR